MSSSKMKLDYDNFVTLIVETLATVYKEDEEAALETVKNNVFFITFGLELLSSYLNDIATLAVKRNDTELLELCKGLMLVVKKEGGEGT